MPRFNLVRLPNNDLVLSAGSKIPVADVRLASTEETFAETVTPALAFAFQIRPGSIVVEAA